MKAVKHDNEQPRFIYPDSSIGPNLTADWRCFAKGYKDPPRNWHPICPSKGVAVDRTKGNTICPGCIQEILEKEKKPA